MRRDTNGSLAGLWTGLMNTCVCVRVCVKHLLLASAADALIRVRVLHLFLLLLDLLLVAVQVLLVETLCTQTQM